MARIEFTSHLARHVPCPPERVGGATLRDALDAYFAAHPRVRPYVLDDQGRLRAHVVVFVGDTQARDRDGLTDPVAADQAVYVLQALSGG
ncbi:MAG TPA: MoaD/ThiS family protein [Polyangiaceae bacterium]|nr:MoaD/ThiS family protein [Polyangiaceae bacterium]